jgi:hypothetical protein
MYSLVCMWITTFCHDKQPLSPRKFICVVVRHSPAVLADETSDANHALIVYMLSQVDLEAIGVTINELADTLGLPATELVECIRTRRSQTGHGRCTHNI